MPAKSKILFCFQKGSPGQIHFPVYSYCILNFEAASFLFLISSDLLIFPDGKTDILVPSGTVRLVYDLIDKKVISKISLFVLICLLTLKDFKERTSLSPELSDFFRFWIVSLVKTINMHPKIVLERRFGYYRYNPLWKTFALGGCSRSVGVRAR